MEFLETIKYHVAQLDSKTFFAYCGGFLLGILLIMSGLLYYYYSEVDNLSAQLEEINEKRSTVRMLFERELRLKKQEADINKMLKEDEHFSIIKYFHAVLKDLKINVTSEIPGEAVQLGGKYREYTLSVRFDGANVLDMKQICELLEKIEASKRVYTKSLDILRSKSVPAKLDVSLVIGTLLNEIPGT